MYSLYGFITVAGYTFRDTYITDTFIPIVHPWRVYCTITSNRLGLNYWVTVINHFIQMVCISATQFYVVRTEGDGDILSITMTS